MVASHSRRSVMSSHSAVLESAESVVDEQPDFKHFFCSDLSQLKVMRSPDNKNSHLLFATLDFFEITCHWMNWDSTKGRVNDINFATTIKSALNTAESSVRQCLHAAATFPYRWLELPQISFLSRKTFAATKTCLSRQNTPFVVTKVCFLS